MSCVMSWNWLLLPKGCSVIWSIVYNVSSIKFSFFPVSYGKIRCIYRYMQMHLWHNTHVCYLTTFICILCTNSFVERLSFIFEWQFSPWILNAFGCLKKWARVDIDIVAYMSFSFTTINVHSSWSDNIFKNILNRRNFWYLFLIAQWCIILYSNVKIFLFRVCYSECWKIILSLFIFWKNEL